MSKLGSAGSLRTGLVVLLLAAVAVAASVPAAIGTMLGARAARQGAEARLAASLSGFRFQQPDRLQKIELMARVLATDPVLAAYLAEMVTEGGDAVKLLDLLEGYQERLAFDLAAVFDTTDTARAAVGAPIGDPASLRSTLATARERDRARGVWRDGTNLYHAAVLPVVREFELLGFVVVALAIDDALARQLAALGGETVIFAVAGSGGAAVPLGGTASPARAAQVIDALAARDDVLTRALASGETVASVAIATAGGRLAGIEPLRDAAGGTVGALIATASPARAFPGLSRIPMAGLGAGLAALAVGALAMILLVTRSQRPWRRLAAYTQSLAEGQDAALPKGLAGDAGRTAAALDRLTSDRRQQRALAHAFTVASTHLHAGRGGDTDQRAAAHQLTLLLAELRRFADAKLGYDAEANLERFTVDLRRLRAALRDREGRILSVAGHRVLAVFEGDGAAFRALSAAAEASRSLAEGESVFDQPEPPVIALTAGTVVSGHAAWGTGAGPVTLGLPVQQLESLVREGTPGDIVMPQALYTELAPAFAQAGAEQQPQRGVMSPQPLFAVPAEVAARVAGLGTPTAVETEHGSRQLADVAVGMTLAHRFEILEERDADSQSVRFTVRDRQRGSTAMMALLRPQTIAAPDDLERLAAAFRRLRGLDHPHVVPVWDFGEAEGLPYVLMPFVAGERLRALLAAGPLSPPAALGLARQMAAGLGAGHAAGVVHGDLRPEHVLVEGSGHVRVGGFAVGAGAAGGASAGFRAPERVGGGGVGPAGDIYAFGATLYECLAGRPAYTGATPSEIQKQQMAGPPAPLDGVAGLPAPFAGLILACLERDPQARPASFDALIASFETLRA